MMRYAICECLQERSYEGAATHSFGVGPRCASGRVFDEGFRLGVGNFWLLCMWLKVNC